VEVLIIGAGLAGCEAAWQLAERGIKVRLVEQKPLRRTPAQHSDALCELVCSNSLRGAALVNAVGLLKEELRRAGSLILRSADIAKVPAGGALAVDRDVFSREITQAISTHPNITLEHRIVTQIPESTAEQPVIVATGPLTGDELAADLQNIVGEKHLAYFDAIAPIVAADSIEWDVVFKQSRWGKGEGGEASTESDGAVGDAAELGDAAYVNCPFDEAEYKAFVAALLAAEKVEPKEFEKARYFEGCLPVEVMASRGEMTLAFGPMKPVGLTNPRTGRRPYAVVQLRPEDAGMTAYNLVGFQTKMTYKEQERVLRMIPGLKNAEFMRMGSVHRNTFLHAPRLLDQTMQLRSRPHLYFAGQVTGVEGYVESAAGGFLCGLMLAEKLLGQKPSRPPETTALGGLLTHLGRETPGAKDGFQPSNITWACMPPHANPRLKKRDRYAALSERALRDFAVWLQSAPLLSVAAKADAARLLSQAALATAAPEAPPPVV
jgi:methylenetetrahydrofolate--tRNA-(uracil-5-)-methyltransferase